MIRYRVIECGSGNVHDMDLIKSIAKMGLDLNISDNKLCAEMGTICHKATEEKEIMSKRWAFHEDWNRFVIAFDESKPIGYLSVEIDQDQNVFMMIKELYVDPAYRKQGVATELIRTFLNWKEEHVEYAEFQLSVTYLANNTPAINLYKKMGFIKPWLIEAVLERK